MSDLVGDKDMQRGLANWAAGGRGGPYSLVFNPLLWHVLQGTHSDLVLIQSGWETYDILRLQNKRKLTWMDKTPQVLLKAPTKNLWWKKKPKTGDSLSTHLIFRSGLIACIPFSNLWAFGICTQSEKFSFKCYNFNNWALFLIQI